MFNKNLSLKVIENSKLNNTFSHAYLFYGEIGVDVFETAFEAIKMMICDDKKCYDSNSINELNYPDLIVINSKKELITKNEIISTIRNMTNTSLVNNKKKIILIKDIDFGNNASLNSLLKYLEEPSSNTYIIMTTNRIDEVISTIKSRVQNILVKRKAINETINYFLENDIDQKYACLFANISSSIKDLKKMDLAKFEKTYNDLFDALKFGTTNITKMKLELNKIIMKDNVIYIIFILNYFFYQILTIVDEKYPLFPIKKALIEEYKKMNNKNKFEKAFHEISFFKKAISNNGNFNLQKENFLLRLIKIYE